MAYSDEVTTDSPYVYWRMGGTASPVADEVAANDLTVTGATFGAAGVVADAVSFDGTDDYAVIDLDLSDTDVLTVECFFYLDSYSGDGSPLLHFSPQWYSNAGAFIINPNNTSPAGTWAFGMNGGTTVSWWSFPQASVSAGAWHHLVVRMDLTSDTLTVWLDGAALTLTELASGTDPGNFDGPAKTLAMMTNAGLYTAGDLAEIAIYKTLLSDARVAAHYAAAISDIPVLPYHSTDDLGGAIGEVLAESTNALFDQPTTEERFTGLIDYRCIYLKNLGGSTLFDVRAWVTPSAATDSAEVIGEDDPTNPAQTIPNQTSAPVGVTFDPAALDYATGLTLGVLNAGASIPIWVRRTVDPDPAAGSPSFVINVSWTGAAEDATITVSYEILVPATFYVDADHPDRSDDWSRGGAADNPAHPFATMQAAAMVLERGDIMQVEPSTLGNANPADPADPDVYEGIRNPSPAGVFLPSALNGDDDPITVRGNIVGDVRPKCRYLQFFELDNWAFEDLQRGYDRGSGDDFATVDTLQNCKDLTFTNILQTGGGLRCLGARGTMAWTDCTTYSPYGGTGHFLDGAGFPVTSTDTSTGIIHAQTFRFENCWFEDIQGEDAIQASLGTASSLEVVGCTFTNILFDPDIGTHTDCIQGLGGGEYLILNCRFINVAQVFIASDYQSQKIAIIGNLVDNADNGFWGQGCEHWVILHNTMTRLLRQGIGIGNRTNETIPGYEQKLTIANNIINYVQIDDGSVIEAASVMENNIFYEFPEQDLGYGAALGTLPEFGTSARLVSAGLTGNFELANSPTDSPGIGDGSDLAGLDITATELGYVTNDLLGRAYATPRDVGAFQSDPSTLVTPEPRPPYVIDKSPLPGATGVARGADVTFTLVPVPGQEIDPLTVSATTVWVADATAFIPIPGVVTLGPMIAGEQAVTVGLLASVYPLVEGNLFPLVLYTVFLEGIADTEGSVVPDTSWSFRVAGTGLPAVSLENLGGGLISFDSGGEAGAVIRRIATAIMAAASSVPDSNPTGSPVTLTITTSDDFERTVTVAGGTLNTPVSQIV